MEQKVDLCNEVVDTQDGAVTDGSLGTEGRGEEEQGELLRYRLLHNPLRRIQHASAISTHNVSSICYLHLLL